MKKVFAMITVAVCAMALLVGCGSSKPSGVQMKDGQTVQTVVDKINEDIGIAMAADVDEMMLKDLFYINPDDVEAYAGKFAMVNVSADNVIAVHAKEGKVDAVKESLEKRLANMSSSFELYLPDQYAKTQKGQVVTKGDYAFLLILGESEETFDQDMEKAVSIIDAAF